MRFKRSSSGPLPLPPPEREDLGPSLELCCGGCVADCGGGCGAELGPLEATEAFDPEEGGVERSGPEAPPGGSRNERRSSGSTSPN